MVALNSNCEEVRCGPGSPQTRWLEGDLAANDEARCTLAYMHHPRFSSEGETWLLRRGVENLWEALYEADADVVFSGHEHNYERFSRRTRRGGRPRGHPPVRSGTGGGGGEGHPEPIANSEVRIDGIDGVLKLTLRPKSYEWEFVPVEGEGH